MEIVTDMGEAALAAFFGPSFSRISAAGPLPGEVRRLSDLLFAGSRFRVLRLDERSVPDRFGPLILLENSLRSNLDALMEALRNGIHVPDGTVCAASKGEGFMGRFGRSWACLEGNLHIVVRLEPRLTLDRAGTAFSILPAVACTEAIRLAAGLAEEPRIKWINDVVVGRRKIGGVLTRQTFHEPLITDAVLGIGVNVRKSPELEGDPFVPATGCLAELYTSRDWWPGLLLIFLLQRIDRLFGELIENGNEPLLDRYRRYDCVIGRRVRIYSDGFGSGDAGVDSRERIASGVVERICDDLSLLINGTRVSSGRLAFESDCDSPSTD